MSDKVLLVKCECRGDFASLIRKLSMSVRNFIWVDGSKLAEYDPYKNNKFLNDMSIYIVIQSNEKISFITNGTTIEDFRHTNKLYKLILNNANVMSEIHNFISKVNSKKSFEELSCVDFKHCEECPLHEFNCDFIQEADKTFGEIMKNIGKTFEEAMNKYEKGE